MQLSPSNVLVVSLLSAVGGFVVGVLVNLFVDYVPARRLRELAQKSPFVSESAIPPLPSRLPRLADGRMAPIYSWSGWGARLSGVQGFNNPHWPRRLLVELGLPLLYVWIVSVYADTQNLPFFVFYAPFLVAVVVIDVEYRWILWSALWPILIAAILEALIVPRVPLLTMLRGGVYGFAIMLLLYFLGILFGQGLGMVSGRQVARTVLGFGDVRLVTVGGFLLGWPGIGFALAIMVFTGAFGAILFIGDKLLRTRRYRAFAAIPYGPYIVIGIATMLYAPWLMGDLLVRLIGSN